MKLVNSADDHYEDFYDDYEDFNEDFEDFDEDFDDDYENFDDDHNCWIRSGVHDILGSSLPSVAGP